jgi:VanZ family protein
MRPWQPLKTVWIWGPVLGYIALIYYLSSLSRFPWSPPYPDYVLHAAEYLVLAVLTARAFNGGLLRPVPPHILGLTFALCVLYAISDEIHQLYVLDRYGDVMDVVADAAGAAIGLAGIHLAQRMTLRNGTT